MSEVTIISEEEVRAVTNDRLAARLGIPQNHALSYTGEVVVVFNTQNFLQNCGPTLELMKQNCVITCERGELEEVKKKYTNKPRKSHKNKASEDAITSINTLGDEVDNE